MHKVPTLFCFFAGTLPAIIRLVKVRQRASPANSLLKHLLLELGLREKKNLQQGSYLSSPATLSIFILYSFPSVCNYKNKVLVN